jgi:hypothetical protein
VQGGEAWGGSGRRGGWGWLGTARRQRAERAVARDGGTAESREQRVARDGGTAESEVENSRAESEIESREQRAEREVESREQRVRSRARAPRVFCFGKWFTEIFSVNRFPFFPSRFYGQIQMFYS